MSLSITLEILDGVRRYLWPHRHYLPSPDRLAEYLLAEAALFDLLRWRRVSRSFRDAADRKIKMISRIDVKLYDGLRDLHRCCGANSPSGGNYSWHSRAPIMVVHLAADHLGIAVDSKMAKDEVKVLVELLTVFRQTVEKLNLDCPIMEFLVSQVDKQQLNVLHFCLENSRKQSMEGAQSTFDPHSVLRDRDAQFESPFFPKLRQLTITSQTDQLEHLSRLLLYTVGVEHIYNPTCIELVCLNVCLAGSWSRVKNVRVFRHVNCFRQWSEAQNLGVRYLQQFTSQSRKATAL
uniref:F-box domain-containing protein n=1 Tax=Steinernema glaseri TaxID=37863 RepID=A0A1I7Z410_9BILA